MLKILQGRFGPYCQLCVRRVADGTRKAENTRQLAVSRRTLTGSLNAHASKTNLLILQRTVRAQGCLKNMHIRTQRIEKPLLRIILGPQLVVCTQQVRHMGGLSRALGTVGRFLRVRYLIFTGAIGGGVAANQTYESWKQHIPDMKWLKHYIPEPETLDKMAVPFRQARELVNRIHLPEKGWLGEKFPKMKDMSDWLSHGSNKELGSIFSDDSETTKSVLPKIGISPFSRDDGTKGSTMSDDRARQDSMNEEILKMQTKYQKEVDRLEKENRDLRKQLNLMEQKTGRKRKMNKSLIDMYSEILDVLTDFDSSYNTQDHLPRVVVVGDQSAGKTSVLEMIARARIFPRGSGEMMTRSPVKVTLSEGPYHVAQFKDSTREFDLTKEEDTEALRKEVEHRMKKSVKGGQTVSTECISMSVKGPGIQRMVLVDLPGIISTETTVMAPDTKEGIKRLVKSYMENPNAIILCIQDGSLDAERSNVTDVVSQIDPSGKRTIFVLTKVDLAESNLYNPNRIKSILDGELFPMKALGYFAVVTGKGNSNDSIDTIRKYENEFFQKSKLLQDGALKVTQTNTNNLSMAVSELFWKMVKENIEQQTDAFKATRYNLETEWKNNFPRLRELDRDELFEKAKGEILDEVISLGAVSPKQWEIMFRKKLWERTATHMFENIYLPAAQAETVGEFNTMVDIKLSEWAYHALPKKSVEVGWDVLHQEFSHLADKDKKKNASEHDEVFNRLKLAVIEGSKSTHNWESKAEESLRVMQRNTLEDRAVQDKQQWDTSVNFMEEALKEQLEKNEVTLRELTGPGSWEQWRHWTYRTPEHKNRIATRNELERILKPQNKHRPTLSQDELTTVKQTLQSQGIEVDAEFIKQTWYHVFREKFIKRALQQCSDCKKGFYYYQHNVPNSGLECHEVVLFWRIHRMLEMTSNALRQQVMNNEARRLERIIKDVLDDFSEDTDRLKKLLTGRPVDLAEELKKVRQIQEKLEEFIEALNREK
ncbi:dynamin-like 120 kDa protein, mitochondrial isoform X2 [Mercenaria mercenaria]|uniref:dynamin-like 120 kDa protein, mitochondrial isoform X2 n=1 Tax=Mercenaria mercenaria TaxID=6596 RepID=UPI00234E3A98|nr:dynamin-like 120 kDa protein, mitochondrial isoform X2 [Mercenaria mercenaria]